ncbi:hypothetical protein D9758_017272 [Tetrapyrgos nigripes]|uniref:Uncharacterized protein n=1 Tax=Tetrapyrgos nigripes TaxID=182062 RepID=A0A8H5C5M2_9AGAR|nr:hypothetical protein D9758_017272 [Tetrapyrgos nigripes]
MSIRRNLFKRHLNSSGPGNMYTPEPIRQAWPPSIESRLLALLHPDDDVPGLMRLQRVFPDLEDMRLFRLFNIF